ncbi:MAG: GNAT family N-acetyltransferase [Rhodobacteraceae bacterium]|nr:GNAT family N-acetyltransferase [Paracoccaceae bacterium]
MQKLDIRPATAQEFSTAIGWAAAEGWNPGLDDLAVFHNTDPDGFLMGWRDGKPVSSISVVKYNDDFGFLGFYIVHPDYRGRGDGIATWNAGMDYLKGCTVGLDGVVDQQANYARSGFVLSGQNIRFSGVPNFPKPLASDLTLRDYRHTDFEGLSQFDIQHFQFDRPDFLKGWLGNDNAHRTILALKDGKICGYGTVRPCQTGYKIAPLFALDPSVAFEILFALNATLPAGVEISIDMPEANSAAISIARKIGLLPVFETARMYAGTAPKLPLNQIFGITSFELG